MGNTTFTTTASVSIEKDVTYKITVRGDEKVIYRFTITMENGVPEILSYGRTPIVLNRVASVTVKSYVDSNPPETSESIRLFVDGSCLEQIKTWNLSVRVNSIVGDALNLIVTEALRAHIKKLPMDHQTLIGKVREILNNRE